MKTIKELQDRFNSLLEALRVQETEIITIGFNAEELESVLYYLKAWPGKFIYTDTDSFMSCLHGGYTHTSPEDDE